MAKKVKLKYQLTMMTQNPKNPNPNPLALGHRGGELKRDYIAEAKFEAEASFKEHKIKSESEKTASLIKWVTVGMLFVGTLIIILITK